MRLSLQLFCFFLFNFYLSQTTNFVYEYNSIPDSTAKGKVKKELMVLSVSNNKSQFYSLKQFKRDSIDAVAISKGFPSAPQSIADNIFHVVKEIPNKNKLSFSVPLSGETYEVSENLNLKWKLTDETQTVMNYNVQKAVTNYGGRSWIAWFTKEIPIQEGPYKFSNLPGLILKVEDVQQNHVFEIKAIQKSPNNFIYPTNKNISPIKIDQPRFVKVYRKYRKDPFDGSRDDIQDIRDRNGYVLETKSQVIKDMTESKLNMFKRDNNVIEIDLLNN